MFRKTVASSLLMLFGVSLLLGAASSSIIPDEVIIRYPEGFTRLVVVDLAKILNDAVLSEAIADPLAAARHPINGIAQIIRDTLEIDPNLVSFIAHGTGPSVSGVSLIQGPPAEATFGPLFGLQFAVGPPQSPFTNWELTESNGLPLIRVGGLFGPVQIQWGYAITQDALWVGTEISFGPPPDVERLQTTMNAITARTQGQGAYFDELLIALGTRGGDIAFVRKTDAALDRPAAAGEQAFGFSMNFSEQGAQVQFDVRFNSAADAASALSDLQAGTSPYLAQDLYQGQLQNVRQRRNELIFTVETNFTGVVGLLLVVMPN